MAFLGPNELPVIGRCPYDKGVRKERLDCILMYSNSIGFVIATNTAITYRQLLSEAWFTGAADTVQRGAVDLILQCVVQENISFVHVYIFSKINQPL